MTWRQAGVAVLFSPVLVGLLLFATVLIAWKLPMFCCERLRAVRWLPFVAFGYYAGALTLAAAFTDPAWWEVLFMAGLAVLGGDWLLPDPLTFVLHPAKRRAAIRAVQVVEQQGGPGVLYGMVAVLGTVSGRHVVSVAINSGSRPPARRFFAVGSGGNAEELDFKYVEEVCGVRPWY